MPEWIAVRLSFQRYRYILFTKIGEYYLSLLAEGKLEMREEIIHGIKQVLGDITEKPFFGDLSPYMELGISVAEYINTIN